MSNEEPLPMGWAEARLSDVCTKPQYGWTTKATESAHGIKFLRTTDISSGKIDWATVPYCLRPPDDFAKYSLKRGDILVSRAGSVGVSIEIEDCPESVFGSYLIRFRALEPILSRYISLFLKSPLYWSQIADSTAGITIPNVNASKLQQISLRLAPLAEQKRIVAKVEALFAENKSAREALDKVSILLRRFRQSVLDKAFRGELTQRNSSDEPAYKLLERIEQKQPKYELNANLTELPYGWALSNIGDLFRVHVGSTPRRKQLRYWNGNIAWVSSSEVAFCRIKATRESITEEGLSESHLQLRPPGTVLLAMIGEGKTRGQAAILDISAATNQNIASILCTETPIPSEYVYYWLQSRYEATRRAGEGGAQPALNSQRVRDIPIPIPPLEEQHRIVAKIEELFAYADGVELAVKKTKQRLGVVNQAVLVRAFMGELVLQDPHDEPASVLLERVKNQKQTTRKHASETLG